MRPVPIPDDVLEQLGAQRMIIGEPGDPTRTDVRPCEYAVTESDLYPGRPAVHALVVLEDGDLDTLNDGGRIMLRLDGGELPWSLTVLPAEDDQ